MSSVYVLGLSGEAGAQRHGVTTTTVRCRCRVGMRRLARAKELLVCTGCQIHPQKHEDRTPTGPALVLIFML